MHPAIANANLDPPRKPVISRGLVPALLAHALLGLALAGQMNWKRAPDPSSLVAVPGLQPTSFAAMGPPVAQLPPTAEPGPALPDPVAAVTPRTAVTTAPTPAPAPAPPTRAAAAPLSAVATAPAPVAEERPGRTAMGAAASPAPVAGARAPAPAPAPDRGATATAPDRTGTQPSFDCRRARSRVERMICADPELARLDRDLGRLHARAKAATPDPAGFKRENDAEWRLRETMCQDRQCVLAWYAHRREQLQASLGEARAR